GLLPLPLRVADPVVGAADLQLDRGQGLQGLGAELGQGGVPVLQRVDRPDIGGGVHGGAPQRCWRYSSMRSALRSRKGMCSAATPRKRCNTLRVSSNSVVNF